MAIDSDQVARLLVELGERTPRIESIVQEADAPRWAIELEDGYVVLAEFDGGRNRLSLETDLGRPPEEHRLATCEALMLFTSVEHASAGFAMALGEPAGEFQLCGHIAMSEIDFADVQSAFLTFADHGQHWRDVVENGAQQSALSTNDALNTAFLA